ncbi:MAG TPA: type I-E CRISPR-associated protein Cas5/CasD [Ilumatobacteraceae bacterium]|nr:type I-E CRISPR-associated protein Cas5/CasD [Ilumatobacteraceae bacterium]
MTAHTLVLRLAAPLQSWGSTSQFNRRDTDSEPTKSAIVGLLAAAEGRRRGDPIEDLLLLRFAVRVDQSGSLLRDYHTVSDFRGGDLRSSDVNAKGQQKRNRGKATAVTQRFYVQDAVFIALIEGTQDVLEGLASAVLAPGFPLALGRRACVPTQPILLGCGDGPVWSGELTDVALQLPWQAAAWNKRIHAREAADPTTVRLSFTVDDPNGGDVRHDVPTTFAPKERSFTSRAVTRRWLDVSTGLEPRADGERLVSHDPLALLGW